MEKTEEKVVPNAPTLSNSEDIWNYLIQHSAEAEQYVDMQYNNNLQALQNKTLDDKQKAQLKKRVSKYKDDNLTKKTRVRKIFASRSYYFDTHNALRELTAYITEEDWCRSIEEHYDKILKDMNLKNCFYIFHNKDEVVDEQSGATTLKTLHMHICLQNDTPKSVMNYMKNLLLIGVHNIETPKTKSDFGQSCLYLVHKTTGAIRDGKYQYGKDEVHVIAGDFDKCCQDGIAGFKSTVDSDMERKIHSKELRDMVLPTVQHELSSFIDDLLDEIMQGKIIPAQVPDRLKKYCRDNDYIQDNKYNSIKYAIKPLVDSTYQDYIEQKTLDMKEHRGLTNIYIEGDTGAGKGTLAGAMGGLLETNPYRQPFESGSSSNSTSGTGPKTDVFGLYKDEDVVVFNDLSGQLYDISGFTATFDPHRLSPTSVRGKNVTVLAHYFLFANNDPLLKFCADATYFQKGGSGMVDSTKTTTNALSQIYRRIPWIITAKYKYDKAQNPIGTVFSLYFNQTSTTAGVMKFKARLSRTDEEEKSKIMVDISSKGLFTPVARVLVDDLIDEETDTASQQLYDRVVYPFLDYINGDGFCRDVLNVPSDKLARVNHDLEEHDFKPDDSLYHYDNGGTNAISKDYDDVHQEALVDAVGTLFNRAKSAYYNLALKGIFTDLDAHMVDDAHYDAFEQAERLAADWALMKVKVDGLLEDGFASSEFIDSPLMAAARYAKTFDKYKAKFAEKPERILYENGHCATIHFEK